MHPSQLWFRGSRSRLTHWKRARESAAFRATLRRLQREDTQVFLSVASAWEVAIKSKLGKLDLPSSPLAFVEEAIDLYGLTVLPVELRDAVRAGELPLHHRDPFDRLLIAQAEVRGIAIATPDEAFGPYRAATLW